MPEGPEASRSVHRRASGGVNPLTGAKCEVQLVEPVCLSASLPDAVMRTHHFRSEVIYLARNFKVRSCSLYPSTYCRGLLLMKSHSKLFILHEEHNVLFHLLVWFFPFPTQNELFICVTLTGLPIRVIPKGIGYLEKSCAYCTCQSSPCPKAALSPVIDRTVNVSRAGGFGTAEPLLAGCAHSPHLPPAPARDVPCLPWMLPKDPDYNRAWQGPRCVTLYSEVRRIKTLTCQC